jgi:hypothetical protein
MYARNGILQNTSKFLDVAHWPFLLNELCPKKCEILGFHSTPSCEALISSTVDRCSAQPHAFEFLYCIPTVPLSPLAMFTYSQSARFLLADQREFISMKPAIQVQTLNKGFEPELPVSLRT